eukprot:TRINITY_DN13657_c0_g1_i1.p1 TRINITY_DN13657_c0_g1~~TRINITY_DN13657_c0_g1_i1.p1  ORF type:complete len:221 (+),score=28.43 TRINITY_DN13657_c0_g1_i1:105-767(+)
MVLPATRGAKGQKRRTCQAKTVHVIRHGEAQHNVEHRFLDVRDTVLTPQGVRQARALRAVMQQLRPEVAVTSAVLRALQTTKAMGFRGPTVVAPDAREVASCPANLPLTLRRKSLSGKKLARRFKDYDWSMVLKDVRAAGGARKYARNIKRADFATSASLRRRARKFTRYLEARPEESIVLVSHGEFLMELTGDRYMDNCEVRSYRVHRGIWRRLRTKTL